MFAFAVRDQPRLFINNINEIVQESNFGTRKLKLPKKVTIFDLKAHPVASKCVGACSDGLVNITIINQPDSCMGFIILFFDAPNSRTYSGYR